MTSVSFSNKYFSITKTDAKNKRADSFSVAFCFSNTATVGCPRSAAGSSIKKAKDAKISQRDQLHTSSSTQFTAKSRPASQGTLSLTLQSSQKSAVLSGWGDVTFPVKAI